MKTETERKHNCNVCRHTNDPIEWCLRSCGPEKNWLAFERGESKSAAKEYVNLTVTEE